MKHNKKHSELLLRTISASVLAPIVLFLIYVGGYAFDAAIMVITLLMAYEWVGLIQGELHNMTRRSIIFWKLAGLVYIALPFFSLIWIRDQPQGMRIIYWLMALIWATDIACYFTGRAIGGWKLAPKISPNKTWSGLVGGIVAAAMVGVATVYITDPLKPLALISLSTMLGIYAQIGDLLESGLKRFFGVKHSGDLLPGHGGILDRVDGIVLVAPKVAFVVLFDLGGILN
jgi:phosphatidate cytidylyltransferase